MSEYDFILDNMRYSYSSVSGYDSCAYGFYLSYIESKSRIGNFFGEFGSFCHDILEKYFKDELDIFELVQYYEENYIEKVAIPPPPYPMGMADKYYNDGLEFFQNFEFDKNNYEIVSIEDKIEYKYRDIFLVIIPDLVLRKKLDSKYILVDYKTSKLKDGKSKFDKEKIEGYKKQLLLYAYFIWQSKNIEIDEIKIWFLRNKIEHTIIVNPFEVQEVVEWFENTIGDIKKETMWFANTDKKNKYFCSEICSMREICDRKIIA